MDFDIQHLYICHKPGGKCLKDKVTFRPSAQLWCLVTCPHLLFLLPNFLLSALLSECLCESQRTHFREYVIKPKACSCERGWITAKSLFRWRTANILWHCVCWVFLFTWLRFVDQINIAHGFTCTISKCHFAVLTLCCLEIPSQSSH